MLVSHFDDLIARKNTASVKWDGLRTRFQVEQALPMWVADMDFAAPDVVLEAMQEKLQHGIFGYTLRTDSYYEAIQQWLAKRHHFNIDTKWIAHAPGIVPGIGFLIDALTDAGDKVVVQPPVYHPFERVIRNYDRQVLRAPLAFDGTRYQMNFDALEAQFQAGAKAWILCSPHNPVGRVWTADELRTAGELALQYNVTVISDEIHHDLVYKNYHHTPFASLDERFKDISVTAIAPSKTFNLAGLQTAAMIIPNPDMLQKYKKVLQKYSMEGANTFGVIALEAAYRKGEPWLNELLDYLEGNLVTLQQLLLEKMPQIKLIKPEGTYLAWLDCRELGFTKAELDHFFVHEAGVAMDEGHLFGEEGTGFQRMNLACPRSYIDEAITNITAAWNKRN